MIAKTDFITYLDAPLHLWAAKHDRIAPSVLTVHERYLMEQGKAIEKMAATYLEAFVLREYAGDEFTKGEFVAPTLFWQQPYEDKHFFARSDAVIRDSETGAADIYEIKSATNIQKEHIYDATFQTLVCETHFTVRRTYLVHLNKEYIRQGEVEIGELFTVTDITEKVEELKPQVRELREHAWRIAQLEAPGELEACHKPDTCPCPRVCHPNLPTDPIYDIPRLNKNKATDLRSRGLLSIRQVPDDYPLSARQREQVQVVKSGEPRIDKPAIDRLLAELAYPLYFLDYETFNPGVPLFDGYHPYQHIVFQYSLHIIATPGDDTQHTEYLATEFCDPEKELLAQLAEDLGDRGSVIVWHKTFESSRNREMAARYPKYASFLEGINQRVFDLMDVFREGHYLHPDFHGSSSIKAVLPVLVPELSYEGMGVSQGDQAMMAWWSLISEDLPPAERDDLIKNLLEYCKLDTLAMVEIWRVLSRL
jgi:hypothetical protein